MDAALLELVACPRCRATAITNHGAGARCGACKTEFPEPAGVPCLVPDPQRAYEGWRREAQRFVELIDESVSALDEQLQRGDLLARTRQRLQRMRAAYADNGQRVAALFRAAGMPPDPHGKAGTGGGGELSIIEYYEQVLRDWAWPDGDGQDAAPATSENRRALELVAATVTGDQPLGRVLVLGAGPARLAHDLHRRFSPSLTVALDLNPFLVLAAQKVLHGGGLKLYEFPVDPDGIDAIAVDHALSAPAAGAPAGFHLVLADAFAAPFRPGSFDTVVTPWFIDIVPRDIRETIGVIHGLLAPGGRWLNYGPLSYLKAQVQAQRYTYEELYDLITLGAFDLLGTPRLTTIDYMHSPASARGKTADVLTFAARRRDLPASYPDDADPPPWMVMPHLPVPRFRGLDGFKVDHPILAYLIGKIDGKRSTADLAAGMIEDHGARPDAALTGTRAMLALLWNAVRGGA
jgi:uncharacterized protein YbaR (Trm112 family)